MGISLDIQSSTLDEFEALQSEGAPSVQMGYGTWAQVSGLFGISVDVNEVFGVVSASEILAAAESARTTAAQAPAVNVAGTDSPVNLLALRVESVVEAAEAAVRIGRDLAWG